MADRGTSMYLLIRTPIGGIAGISGYAEGAVTRSADTPCGVREVASHPTADIAVIKLAMNVLRNRWRARRRELAKLLIAAFLLIYVQLLAVDHFDSIARGSGRCFNQRRLS